jgi:hypothetical protein
MEYSGYAVSMITLPFGNVLRYDNIHLTALRCTSLGNILNLLIAEVAYAVSNISKTIIQIQQPTIDLYLAESSSVHKDESSTSSFIYGCLDSLKLLAKKTFKFQNDV